MNLLLFWVCVILFISRDMFMEPCVCVISKIYSMYCCSHTDVCTLKCTFLAIIICPWISEFSLNKMSVKKFRYRYFSCIRKSYPIFRYIRCHICIIILLRCHVVLQSHLANMLDILKLPIM